LQEVKSKNYSFENLSINLIKVVEGTTIIKVGIKNCLAFEIEKVRKAFEH
jgi:hypothetical protein